MAAEDVGKVFGTERIRIEGLGARNKDQGTRFMVQGSRFKVKIQRTKDQGARLKIVVGADALIGPPFNRPPTMLDGSGNGPYSKEQGSR